MAKSVSTKRRLIDQANSQVVIATGFAAFIFVFSMVATKTLIGQAGYQNHIIGLKKTAVNQLKSNITAANDLASHYNAFIGTSDNILGGNPVGTGAQDGDNAKIILDALPSNYDFPALATSLDKMLSAQGLTINSITGTDDEIAQSSNKISGSPKPSPIPFTASVTGDYASIQKLISQFELSIRPFQVQTIELSGNQAKLTMNITAQTFYQPAKTFSVHMEVK